MLAGIDFRLDVNMLERQAAETLAMNDIARIGLKLAQPIFPDPYSRNRSTGAFIVIDEATNDTFGAGMILWDQAPGLWDCSFLDTDLLK